ncbi:hypothetical protein LZ554_004158 [Drepanopeziza brunnea f. sp. 'monogermtubi']|nr:hypothetical protein LZ554_004158 [Drepanopeziza brunnea f. sp. 'monogermtubi']
MMFIKALAAAITLISPAVLAAPQNIPDKLLEITLCKDAGLVNCIHPVAKVNACQTFPTGWDKTITSLDPKGRTCTYYTDTTCSSTTEFFYNGSIYDLTKSIWEYYNDNISSYNCL